MVYLSANSVHKGHIEYMVEALCMLIYVTTGPFIHFFLPTFSFFSAILSYISAGNQFGNISINLGHELPKTEEVFSKPIFHLFKIFPVLSVVTHLFFTIFHIILVPEIHREVSCVEE